MQAVVLVATHPNFAGINPAVIIKPTNATSITEFGEPAEFVKEVGLAVLKFFMHASLPLNQNTAWCSLYHESFVYLLHP